jgi:hypothetical protein
MSIHTFEKGIKPTAMHPNFKRGICSFVMEDDSIQVYEIYEDE